MKNRILAALLALVLGVPLYLLAADAAPAAAADLPEVKPAPLPWPC